MTADQLGDQAAAAILPAEHLVSAVHSLDVDETHRTIEHLPLQQLRALCIVLAGMVPAHVDPETLLAWVDLPDDMGPWTAAQIQVAQEDYVDPHPTLLRAAHRRYLGGEHTPVTVLGELLWRQIPDAT